MKKASEKRLSGHVAIRIDSAARCNVIFTDFIFMPIAQLLHYTDVKMKMKVLKLGNPKAIPQLDRKKAIDTGSKALTESHHSHSDITVKTYVNNFLFSFIHFYFDF